LQKFQETAYTQSRPNWSVQLEEMQPYYALVAWVHHKPQNSVGLARSSRLKEIDFHPLMVEHGPQPSVQSQKDV